MDYKSKPSIVVYGGTGFIGSNFANYAARKGAIVTVCGKNPPAISLLDDAVKFVSLNAVDLQKSLEFLKTSNPDVIVFGISGITPRQSADPDPELALTEIRSLANVIQGAHQMGVKQLIYCSSGGAIYGDGKNVHLETDACFPKSIYGKLKLQSEGLVRTLCEPLGISAAILRIANPYGPGQSPAGRHGAIAVFTGKMLAGEPITIFGSPEAAKDYIFIDDVSAAIWASITCNANGTFNVASGFPTDLKTLIKKIADACSVEPVLQNVELSASEVSTFTLDIAKIRLALNWNPLVDLDSGIAQTRNWIRQTFFRNS